MAWPFDHGTHELTLGSSFDPRPKVGFHTIRYDFQPASVDTSKEACVEVKKGNQIDVTVPHVEGSGVPHTVFKGNKQNLLKECVLIINHDTGTFTLEKLASKCMLKKTRLEGSSKAMQHLNSGRTTPVDGKKPNKCKASSSKISPEKERLEKEKEKQKEKEPAGFSIAEALKVDDKKVDDISDSSSSSSSSDDDDDMEEVKPIHIPPTQSHKVNVPNPKSKPGSSSSSHAAKFGVLDNDLALSESSSDDDSD